MSLLTLLLVLSGTLRVAGQAAMPDMVCVGATKHYGVNPTPGSTYTWKINGVTQATSTNEIDITWGAAYPPSGSPYTLSVQEKSVSGCYGAEQSGLVYVSIAPEVVFVSCFDNITTLHAKPFRLKGGLPLNGVYSGPGVTFAAGVYTFSPLAAGAGTKTITYTYTNAGMCSVSQSKDIVVQTEAPFTCGTDNWTDIRDNRAYPTIQIGPQCWLAANLNYGTPVASSQVQTDNCITEKYCYNNVQVNGDCQDGYGFYQWDELMKYDNTPASQGICPPGWHVPVESEWMTMFDFYGGNALAGKPLQDLVAPGFHALSSGILYQDPNWSFRDLATFFWSSTPVSTDPAKIISHGMNIDDGSVSYYESLRSNAFPVRCLRD